MGPPGCWRAVCSPAVLYLPVLQFLQSFSPVVPVQQSVVLLVLGQIVSFYPPIGGVAGFWDPPSQPASAAILQYIPSTLPDHQNAAPGVQKAAKMRSQAVPEDPKISKKSKICEFKKTSVFTMFSTHLTIICGQDIHPQITQKTAYHLRLQV